MITFYPNKIMYAGFDAAAEPSISGQVATMSGGETTGPLYDLLDNRRTTQLSIDTNGETTAAVIQVDATASLTADYAIIDNHNLKTADAFYYIEQGDALITGISAAYSGALGSALTADVVNTGEVTVGIDGIALVLFTSAADTKWELLIKDTDTFDADVVLGELVLGSAISLSAVPEQDPNYDYGYKTSGYIESGGGSKYGYGVSNTGQQRWRLNFKYMLDADVVLLKGVLDITKGSKYPFYIDLGESATPHLYRVRFLENTLNFKKLTGGAWSGYVLIEEEI
jgi:hypothetical protein